MELFARSRALGKSPSTRDVTLALREAYVTTFALYAVPGVLLGVPLGRGNVGSVGLVGLVVLGVLLSGVTWWLADRTRRDERAPVLGAVRASIQAASAPAVPFLLACATWRDPLAFLALLSVAGVVFVLVTRIALPKWATLRWKLPGKLPF